MLRFGPMRALVLGLEAVLPDGSLFELIRDEGMTFLRESAVEKVRAGLTTLKEINKVTFIE